MEGFSGDVQGQIVTVNNTLGSGIGVSCGEEVVVRRMREGDECQWEHECKGDECKGDECKGDECKRRWKATAVSM